MLETRIRWRKWPEEKPPISTKHYQGYMMVLLGDGAFDEKARFDGEHWRTCEDAMSDEYQITDDVVAFAFPSDITTVGDTQ